MRPFLDVRGPTVDVQEARKPPVNVQEARESSANDPTLGRPQPPHPCEECKRIDIPTSFCVNCDSNFCDECWSNERPHKQGKIGPDGLPHEKADPVIVNRLKETFTPPDNPETQEKMHMDDEDTTWFGIAKDASNIPVFQDYGRYATLMANSATGESVRYPQLVSFIGQTGAGKSTVVKMLIEQWRGYDNATSAGLFPTPIPGSVRNENVPTSGDVHLYADPATYLGPYPLLYADCEGLEGGENNPVAIRHRGDDHRVEKRLRAGSDGDRKDTKKRWKMPRGSQRDIAWATSPETKKRQYAVTQLYPRLLYTFSDVIVFVLQNSKTFESTVLSKLLDWAHTSMEKSLNQPTLPHAIIALNATDTAVDQQQWGSDFATENLMDTVAGAIVRDAKYKDYAEYWTNRGKVVRAMKDLLECYYASVRVVRIPKKGRYMLINEQVSKLHQEITASCNVSYNMKRKARMLSNSDELNVYLQSAFDHFSQKLDTPFNFIEVAWKNNPIPNDFGGNILKLAAAVKNAGRLDTGLKIFRELSAMVASCIVLDCVRNGHRGTAELLLDRYYMNYCDFALEDFCAKFCQCEFETRRGRCVNVREGHSKGHQNGKGNIIGMGPYVSTFNEDTFDHEWLILLREKTKAIHAQINEQVLQFCDSADKRLTLEIHRSKMEEFFKRVGGATRLVSHSTCFCCLRDMPEHPLPCGHVLCWPCISAYGVSCPGFIIQMNSCPLHASDVFDSPWFIKYKPDLAGIRILTLDGGGIRGIVELEVLREIEKFMGDRIRIQNFFDLIVGTSTGGINALGLGVGRWSVEQCLKKFKALSNKAFTPRSIGTHGFSSVGIRYRTKPMEEALQEAFGTERLFGGSHSISNSYYTKVAVTGSTGTGDRAVVFTNYNREPDPQDLYSFIRPDSIAQELRTWEAARATSAAPSYFRPFVNKETNETFLDGAVYYNNPCKVAYHESKLIWHDVADRHPDILLSIGTGHNSEDSPGSAEPRKRLQKAAKLVADDKVSIQTRRNQGFGSWFKNVALAQFLQIMVNRVDNILSAEQIWREFRVSVDDSHGRDGHRYMRISPKLGFRPPRLDEKEQIERLSYTVIEKLKGSAYQLTIAKIVHRLIASCFYFEKRGSPQNCNGYYSCKGKIRCRFHNGSNELRELGFFLQNHQKPGVQPFFTVYERHLEDIKTISITADIVQRMITRAEFSLAALDIRVSDKQGPTTIALGLQYENLRNEIVPISGFPRCIALDHVRRESIEQPHTSQSMNRQPCRRRQHHSWIGKSNAPVQTKDTGSPLYRAESSRSSQSPSVQVPGNVEGANDWVSRRIASSRQRRSRAPRGPLPYPESSSSASSSATLPTVVVGPPTSQSAELSVGRPVRTTASAGELDDEDEDLVKALALSQAEAEERAIKFTVDGINLEELEEALRRSKIDQ